ncbi:MAG: hypothetical protein ACN6OV_08485 [Acinetobacter sp.]|uniref:hypothetical protein n=1 Tax=Acinetobacter sp. TaxID=472 RepID=UPI003D050D3D
MNRLLLILLSQLAISTSLIVTTNVHAANDLERWNSEVGRTVRQTHSDKLAQTTYREMDSRNVTVSKDMKTVYPQIETRSQVAGSKTRVVAEAVLEVDKDKVWKDWNKKLNKWGKGTAGGVAGSLIVQGIMDAVDWVMDPENNQIVKRPEQNSNTENTEGKYTSDYQYFFSEIDGKYTYAYTPENSCITHFSYHNTAQHQLTYTFSGMESSGVCKVKITYVKDGSLWGNSTSTPQRRANPHKTSNPPTNEVVSDAEKERVLKDLLNDPKYADIANQMIGNSYTIGSDNPEPDLNIVNDIKDAQKGALKSDDPKGDGRTRTDPKIDTGTEIKGESKTETKSETQVDEKTVINPDGSTTTTGTNVTNNTTITNNTFEIKPFCDYAAKLCDWLDWTKDEPELDEDSEIEIEEEELVDYEYSEHIKFNATCPFSPRTEIFPMGILGDLRVRVDFSYFCEIATMMKSFVVALSGFIAVLMLAYAAKDI